MPIETEAVANSVQTTVDAVKGGFIASTGWITGQWTSMRKTMALRKLEGKLAKIFNIANGHKKKKVPFHSPQYVSLWNAANEAIKEFCAEYGVNSEEVFAQMPAMRELQQWGSPAPPKSSAFMQWAVGVPLCAAALIAAGWGVGLMQWLVTYGHNLAPHAH